MPPKQDETLMIEDAEIFYRNFKGKEGMYNREGQMTFCVNVADDDVEGLIERKWNVKYTKVREEGDEPRPYIPVEVKFTPKPPRVVMITNEGRTRTNLDEDSIEVLDYANILKVDIILNPYDWTMANGDTGRKAYLKTMFVTIDEDELEKKYAKLEKGASDGS